MRDKEKNEMDAYERSNAEAAERAAAKVGAPYQGGGSEMNWYRWEGSNPGGSMERGAGMETLHHAGLQVYADGEWHPVTGFGYHTQPARPAADNAADREPEDSPERPALQDSSAYLLEAAGAMTCEGLELVGRLRRELDREDSDAEYLALDMELLLQRLHSVMLMVQETEGVDVP